MVSLWTSIETQEWKCEYPCDRTFEQGNGVHSKHKYNIGDRMDMWKSKYITRFVVNRSPVVN